MLPATAAADGDGGDDVADRHRAGRCTVRLLVRMVRGWGVRPAAGAAAAGQQQRVHPVCVHMAGRHMCS